MSRISLNVPGISEVPSEARNLDAALAKSDMHLLGDPDKGDPRQWRSVSLGGISKVVRFVWRDIFISPLCQAIL